MDRQHGGAFRVSGYIALALLALAVLEAAEIRHLFKHRNIEIALPATQIHAPSSKTANQDDDYGVIHAFPEGLEVCSGFNTICWQRL
jgi:hypothetical protein